MIRLKTLASALVVSGALAVSGMASAADASTTGNLTFALGTSAFDHAFGANSIGDTFTDRYNFTLSYATDLSSIVSTFSPPPGPDGIQITGFSLVNSGGLSLFGSSQASGIVDVWTLASPHLVADTYHLLVSGKVLSNDATAYSGHLTVTAVPEPDTYGMLLAGVGVIGMLARRRQRRPSA